MSLIADALKTAQRERQKRAAASDDSGAGAAPLLIPLRGAPAPSFSWTRALIIGVGGAAVIGAVIVGIEVRASARRAPLPAVPAPIAGDQIIAPAASATLPSSSAVVPTTDASTRRTAPRADGTPGGRAPTRGRPARVAAAAPINTPAAAPATAPVPEPAPQGRSRDEGATVPPAAASAGTPSGRLRIAVDQPSRGEVAGLFAEAVLAHRGNDLATARALYERLLAVTPDDPDLLNNLGVLLTSEREYDRASELLRRAVSLAPTNAAGWANLGFALREQGKAAESISAFQHALALDPKRPGARINIAQQYMAMGSLAEAREVVDQLLIEEPTSAEAHYTRGQLLEMQGDRAAAIREYADFLRLAPPRLAPYMERVRRHLDSLGAKVPDE